MSIPSVSQTPASSQEKLIRKGSSGSRIVVTKIEPVKSTTHSSPQQEVGSDLKDRIKVSENHKRQLTGIEPPKK